MLQFAVLSIKLAPMCYAGQMRLVTLELYFNSHVSAVAHKAHVRASLILRTFQTRDPVTLKLEMWANAQRDGRPLFNAAKFG